MRNYHGVPAFAGDMTKELIVVTSTARKEQRAVPIAYQVELLEAFSGIPSPVARGQKVDDELLRALFGYAQQMAALSWTRGRKYFHRHLI